MPEARKQNGMEKQNNGGNELEEREKEEKYWGEQDPL